MNPKTRRKKNRLVLANRQGQGLTEYIILVVLVGIVSLSAAQMFGQTVKKKITQAKEEINQKFPRF